MKRNILTISIFAAIGIGVFIPEFPLFSDLLPFLIGTLLFLSFLKVDFSFKSVRVKDLLFYPVIVWGIVPFIIFFITKNTFPLLHLGLFLAAITPVAIGAPVISDVIDGNRELTIISVLIFNILAPLTYPLLLKLYFPHAGMINITLGTIIPKVFLLIIIPLVIAWGLRTLPFRIDKYIKIGDKVKPFLYVVMIAIAVSSVSESIRQKNIGTILGLFLGVFLLATIYYGTGLLLPFSLKKRKSYASVLGHKNVGLTIWVALSFLNEELVIPAILYSISQHTLNGVLVYFFCKPKDKHVSFDES